jgi:hypothetical protein
VKANTAAELVPVLVTLALDPAAPVVTLPTATVAAVPFVPFVPLAPAAPASPRGMVNASTAAELLPVFVTAALDPGAPVVTLPTATVAAAPGGPSLAGAVEALVMRPAASTIKTGT